MGISLGLDLFMAAKKKKSSVPLSDEPLTTRTHTSHSQDNTLAIHKMILLRFTRFIFQSVGDISIHKMILLPFAGSPTQTTLQPPSTKAAVCLYKGKSYTQGQTWQDACQYNCSCDDASIGYYRCKNLCPDYQQLPPDCKLVTVQGQCCPRLDCSITVDVSTNPPIIISANKYCSYKGHFYTQDQTWNDGCSQTCTCTDASRGFYSCGSVCLNWDGLPAICHLEDAPPGMCCKQPNCPAGVIINIPVSYKTQYPSSVNPNYNYV